MEEKIIARDFNGEPLKVGFYQQAGNLDYGIPPKNIFIQNPLVMKKTDCYGNSYYFDVFDFLGDKIKKRKVWVNQNSKFLHRTDLIPFKAETVKLYIKKFKDSAEKYIERANWIESRLEQLTYSTLTIKRKESS